MRRYFAAGFLGGAAIIAAFACGDSTPEQLPAIGEVVLEVDTDAPVPQVVNRVRIDVFSTDGSWIESRDVVRVNAVDWPLSFALTAQNPNDTRDVLVRLRAYPEGRTRDYRGERFTDVTTFAEPKVAQTVADLCDGTPALPAGHVVARIGERTITGYIAQGDDTNVDGGGPNDCTGLSQGGAAAFKVDISQSDEYRFDVDTLQPDDGTVDPVLFLRGKCNDPFTQISCADDTNVARDKALIRGSTDHRPSLVVHLDPGSYTLFVHERQLQIADIGVRWGKTSDFHENDPAPGVNVAQAGDPAGKPRLLVASVDHTPPDEPSPQTAIDRLVRVQIKPNQAAKARVLLRSACMGTMAKLSSAGSNSAVVLDQAESCVDTEKTRAKVVPETLVANDGVLALSRIGSVTPNDPCATGDNSDNAVCVPGGAFLFGAFDTHTTGDDSTAPEHFALMHRFWLDKNELSVARYRLALEKGFKPADGTPLLNSGPLPKSDPNADGASGSVCTYSLAPVAQSRENYALNCMSWQTARAFCQFVGGDLPTEAQWEYAATSAGRPFKTRWPWGGDDLQAIDCDRTVFARNDPKTANNSLLTTCADRGYGPVPLDVDVGPSGDVSVGLGLLNLGGGSAEWVLDAFERFDSPCWQAASLFDPMCWEVNAPRRSTRGGAWSFEPIIATARLPSATTALFTNVAIRCAYSQKPTVLP